MTIEDDDYEEEEQSSPIKMQAMQRDLLNLQPLTTHRMIPEPRGLSFYLATVKRMKGCR